MRFKHFDIEKAAQAAAALLRRESAQLMTRIRLMKLLYIANRRMLKAHGRPIIAARAVAMKNGPVLSEVYGLLDLYDPKWSRFIENDGTKIVRLHSDPGESSLSPAEIKILDEVTDELAPYEDWEIVGLTHRFREWDSNYPDKDASTSYVIPLTDILGALDMNECADEILGDLADEAEFDRLFAS